MWLFYHVFLKFIAIFIKIVWITCDTYNMARTNTYKGFKRKEEIRRLKSHFGPVEAEENVNADWNATSGDAMILNKPNIGSGGEANVQADWDETGTSDDAFIKNKPELGDLDLSAFFAEFTYGSGLLTKIEYWNSTSKNTQYYTKDLTYTSGTLTQSVLTNNISSATQTKVLAYDNSGNLTTITKS